MLEIFQSGKSDILYHLSKSNQDYSELIREIFNLNLEGTQISKIKEYCRIKMGRYNLPGLQPDPARLNPAVFVEDDFHPAASPINAAGLAKSGPGPKPGRLESVLQVSSAKSGWHSPRIPMCFQAFHSSP